MIKSVIKSLSYFIFPRRCDLCGDVVYPSSLRCDECSSLKIVSGERCALCGCLKDDCCCDKNEKAKEYKGVVAPYYYEKSIVKAIHNFKLYSYKELTNSLADEIQKAIDDCYADVKFDMVSYIPMTDKSYRKRGYNQSRLLAERVAKNMDLPLVDALKKTMDTNTQRGSSAKQRQINLHGVFDINVDYSEIDNKCILLIDDVKTTGTTLSECAYVLNGYGARAVYCATVAVVKRGTNND